MGAAALFPWYLAIAIAVLVVGLASACAYQFRVTNNPLYLVAMCLMTALASFLDGVSVWELLNNRQNSGLHAAAAHESALDQQLKSTQEEAETIRTKIADVVQEYTNMNNDGNRTNDGLIPGKVALAESLKADLANVQARVDELRTKTIDAASTTAVTGGERHVLLQMADEHPNPARWIISWASVVFLVPEFTLALLAWSMHGGPNRRRQSGSSPSGEEYAGAIAPAHLTQQWLLHQQHLQALHSMPMVTASGHAVSPQVTHRSGEQITEWNGTLVQPLAPTHLAVAGRTSTVSSTTHESISGASAQPAVSNVRHSETASASIEAPVSQPISPLAAINGHPGLIHHALPDAIAPSVNGMEPQTETTEAVASEDSASSSGLLSLREAKRRKFMGGSPTKHHKQKGRKTRNLTELVSRLN